jgi:hypothetical protein
LAAVAEAAELIELLGQQRPYRGSIQFRTIRMQLEQRAHQRLVVGQTHRSPPDP